MSIIIRNDSHTATCELAPGRKHVILNIACFALCVSIMRIVLQVNLTALCYFSGVLNFIWLWVWIWCHWISYVRLDWNVCAIVHWEISAQLWHSWNAVAHLEAQFAITFILKVCKVYNPNQNFACFVNLCSISKFGTPFFEM